MNSNASEIRMDRDMGGREEALAPRYERRNKTGLLKIEGFFVCVLFCCFVFSQVVF